MSLTPASVKALKQLYGPSEDELSRQSGRYLKLARIHNELFGPGALEFFSAPGRTEIGGNHTDHNAGRVLAAAVNLDTVAAARKTSGMRVRLKSEGYDALYDVDLTRLEAVAAEKETPAALIRGIAARMSELNLPIGGFDAAVTSSVLVGSGLSSSAAFEVLIATIFDGLYGGDSLSPKKKAQICQFAENRYFGKPSGLMDQTASAVGGLVGIDFHSADPRVTEIQFDFSGYGYCLVVVATGSAHDDLTDAYAAIPAEMRAVARELGGEVLRDIPPEDIVSSMPKLRGKVSDRAILRALHFIDENRRVSEMVDALESADLTVFFSMIIESGESSWKLLQNLVANLSGEQPLPLALEQSRRILKGRGAWRVHGGGFAGTILAFVPFPLLDQYVKAQNALFGPSACTILSLRGVGATRVDVEIDE